MKKIVFVLSEWGYWGEELIGPLEACDAAGYEITFVTPTGKKPIPLESSVNPRFIDPPLNKPVTSPEMVEKTWNVDNLNRLDHPRNLAEWFPRRPFPSAATYLRDMEPYYRRRREIEQQELTNYDGNRSDPPTPTLPHEGGGGEESAPYVLGTVSGWGGTERLHYDAIVVVGGSGALVDLANNQRLHSIQHEGRN